MCVCRDPCHHVEAIPQQFWFSDWKSDSKAALHYYHFTGAGPAFFREGREVSPWNCTFEAFSFAGHVYCKVHFHEAFIPTCNTGEIIRRSLPVREQPRLSVQRGPADRSMCLLGSCGGKWHSTISTFKFCFWENFWTYWFHAATIPITTHFSGIANHSWHTIIASCQWECACGI